MARTESGRGAVISALWQAKLRHAPAITFAAECHAGERGSTTLGLHGLEQHTFADPGCAYARTYRNDVSANICALNWWKD
jgi:hypothetical protein